MKFLVKLNIFLFLIFLLIVPFGHLSVYLFWRIIKSLIFLIIILVLGGINLTAIFQLVFNQKLNFGEFISLSSLFSLTLIPFIVTIEFSQFEIIFPLLPIANSFLIFLFLILAGYFYQERLRLIKFPNFISILRKKSLFTILPNPFFITLIIYIVFIFIIFNTYYPLPELDPYYWLYTYTNQFADNTITPITLSRPLFSSLAYIFNISSALDLYAYFKYVLPCLTILILFPAYLVSKKFSLFSQKILILLFPFINISTIIYLQFPIPQAILTILTFYFLFFSIYSWLSKRKIFYYLAGFSIFFAFFYQESAIGIFLIWILATLFSEKRYLIESLKKNKLVTFLLFIILISNFSILIKGPYLFVTQWVSITIPLLLALETNFLFPEKYINIDGNPMGWGDLWGVIKYYLYYVGPPIFITFSLVIYNYLKNNSFKNYLKNKIVHKKEVLAIFISFILFFTISEILPRFFNLALLPERAWSSGSIFFLIFFILIFRFFKDKYKFIYYILIITFIVNIGGAIYINNLKKYIITREQLNSAEWIRTTLPKNRIIFTDINRDLLKTHSQSEVFIVPAEFYYNVKEYNNSLDLHQTKEVSIKKRYIAYMAEIEEYLIKLKNKNPLNEQAAILKLFEENKKELEKISQEIDPKIKNKKTLPHMYIYYSRENKKNPYTSRPYYNKKKTMGDLIFDKYPKKFKRIYFNQEENIIIWKIL